MDDSPIASNGVPRPPDSHRFGVPEVALLMLATILGLAVDGVVRSRGGWGTLADLVRVPVAPRPVDRTMRYLSHAVLAVVPLAASWSLALLASIDGAARPWKRLLRRPGLVSSLTIVPATLVAAALARADIGPHPAWSAFADRSRTHLVEVMAVAVAAWWMVLLRGRMGRVAPGWADRPGLALGAFWIFAFGLLKGAAMIIR